MIAYHGPVYMRIGGPPIPDQFIEETFVIGQGRLHRTGDRATVVTTGTVTPEVVRAVDLLVDEGVLLDLICMPTVTPVDADLICQSAARTGHVITIEEHYVRGGLSAAVAECTSRVAVRRDAIGLPHTHIVTGTYDGLIQHYALDAESLRRRLRELVSGQSTAEPALGRCATRVAVPI
jgi:transketolase